MLFYESHWFGDSNSYQAYSLENFSIPCHFHRSYEIISVNEGSIHLTVEDKNYQLKKGEIAFVFPNQLHSYLSIGHTVLVFIIFSPEMIGSFSIQYQNMVPKVNVFSYKPLYADELQFPNIFERKSFLYHICGILIERTDFYNRKTKSDKLQLLHQLLLYIDAHLEEDCSLMTVAKKLEYDYAYLSKFFHERVGMTYTAYLNQYRIMHACYILRNTKEKIVDISIKCGYDNQRAFNRNFKKIVGVTPVNYRNSVKYLV